MDAILCGSGSGAEEQKRLLLSLLIQSDQELIGMHVKATISSGLIDGDLRGWAEAQVPILQAELEALQRLGVEH